MWTALTRTVRCVNVCTRLVLSWYRYAQVKICTCTKLMLANQNKPASTRVGTHARRVVRLGRSGKLEKNPTHPGRLTTQFIFSFYKGDRRSAIGGSWRPWLPRVATKWLRLAKVLGLSTWSWREMVEPIRREHLPRGERHRSTLLHA